MLVDASYIGEEHPMRVIGKLDISGLGFEAGGRQNRPVRDVAKM
jgi:hypothetical protein